MPGCGRRFWCYILPAEPARTEQDGKCRSSDAGGSDPQVFSWSYPVSGNKKPTNQLKPRAGWDFWIQLHWPPFAGLIVLRSKEQDCFCSCDVLFPCSQPLATAGIEKGWECWDCWDKACLKPCAQLGHLYSWDFFLCLVLVIPFILSCSYRTKPENIYSKLLNI